MKSDFRFWMWISLTLFLFGAAALWTRTHMPGYDDTRKAVSALERIANALERANQNCR